VLTWPRRIHEGARDLNLDEILMLLLALVSGVLLFVGLAQALEGRPRRPSPRRASHRPFGLRSFSAEERVLEHRARGARPAGSSPFATPPPRPVVETPRATWPSRRAEGERPAPEQTSLLDAGPSGEPPLASTAPVAPASEAPSMGSPSAEPAPSRLETSVSEVNAVTPRRLSMPAPVEEESALTEPIPEVQEGAEVMAPAAADPLPVAAPAETTPPDSAAAASPSDASEPAVAPAPLSLSPALVVECARLLKAGRPAEVRMLAEPLLKGRGRGRARTPASYDRALLWSLVGLALREEDDGAGLRAAFEQGVRALPKSDGDRPDPAVLALTESLGSQLLTLGETTADASGASLATLRLSVGLLRGAAVCEPGTDVGPAEAEGADVSGGDELPSWGKALRAHLAVERARDALAGACTQKVIALLERDDRAGAHRWIQEVAGWDELGGRMEDLENPYWKAVHAEVAGLTSQALESSDDLDAAVRALQSAEAVVRGLPASASPQLGELRRRLWWSYTKLGVQRMEGGDEGAALEPLYHALRLAEGDADRETETRRSLALGLDTLAARASDAIAERLGAGDHAAAESAGQALCRAIDRGLAEGVSQEELAGALDKRQRAMGLIAQADAR
jgi:hypothetical protein